MKDSIDELELLDDDEKVQFKFGDCFLKIPVVKVTVWFLSFAQGKSYDWRTIKIKSIIIRVNKIKCLRVNEIDGFLKS